MTSSAATAIAARMSSTPASGTIPQRLLLMNGEISREKTKAGFLNASGQIAALAADDRTAVETAFLAVLTRRPTPEELAHFTARLGQSDRRRSAKSGSTDLFWIASEHDRILLEPLKMSGMSIALPFALDRRGFLKLAGLSWLTPVGELLAQQAEQVAGRPSRSSCSGWAAAPASSRPSTPTRATRSPAGPRPSPRPSRESSSPRALISLADQMGSVASSARWSARKATTSAART